jgi:glycosyltransferase involved in cell wall biosynthesis
MEDPAVPEFRIRAGGYLGESDRPYLEEIRHRVSLWRRPERFEYIGELTRAEKIAFLQGMHCMSLPTEYRESKGLSVLEAWANGVPVVLPDHGTFTELVRATGGGLLHQPGSPPALAAALRHMLIDPAKAAEMGNAGQQAVRREFTADLMARRTLSLYQNVCSAKP